MKRYKCWNCLDDRNMPGREFEADKPVCPTCGLDPVKHPEGKGLLVEIKPCHFVPPHPVIKSRGTGKRACDGKPVGTASQPCTAEPPVVTCRACQQSDEFRKAAAEWGHVVVVAERDYAVADPNANKGE